MSSDSSRRHSNGAGAAAVAPGGPGTGVAPGSYRGAGATQRFGESERNDHWWLKPLAQALGLVVLIGYANYAAILGPAHYHYMAEGRHYLSPFYSPYLHPRWLPIWLSPALLVSCSRSVSAPRATTTARPTTGRSSPIRWPAPWAR
jgi:hypothetical protein